MQLATCNLQLATLQLATLSLDGRAISPLHDACSVARTVRRAPLGRAGRHLPRGTSRGSQATGPTRFSYRPPRWGPGCISSPGPRTRGRAACWALRAHGGSRPSAARGGGGGGGGGRGETGLPPAVGAEEVVYIPQDWNPEEAWRRLQMATRAAPPHRFFFSCGRC